MNKINISEKDQLNLLKYEIEMFNNMYERLVNKNDFPKDIENAILESYLLHTRNLIEFFMGNFNKKGCKKYDNDIIVSDFKNRTGEMSCITKEEEWKIKFEDKDKISKRLNHLSKERLVIEKEWKDDITKFKKEISKKIDEFYGNIKDKKIDLDKEKEISITSSS